MLLSHALHTMSRSASSGATARLATTQRHLTTAPRDVQRITVFGAGLMGSGIVQVAAQAGYKVTMVDTNEKALE